MNSKIEKAIAKTLSKSSPARAWSILIFCACCFVFAVFLRFFVLSVWNFDDKRTFVCKLAVCKKNSEKGDLLLARASSGNSVFLWQVGKSGDSIEVPTPFDTISFSIPQKGDTIIFEALNPMLWDAMFNLYKGFHPKKEIRTEISLWSKDGEMPFAFVGRASISGRPVSEREVVFLPWHELRLLELQLQKIFPAIDSIYFKRKVFDNSVEIKDFIAHEELFYLSCQKQFERQKICYDSREKGFFKKSEILGKASFFLY